MIDDVRARVLAAFPDMCARLAAGELIKDVLASYGIERTALSRHILADPVARKVWDESRQASADAYFQEAMEVARNRSKDVDPQQARLHVDTLKWAARIRNPALYSDKSTVDVNVRTVDLTQIIRDANARLAAQQAGRIIDATYSSAGIEHGNARAQSALPAAILADLL